MSRRITLEEFTQKNAEGEKMFVKFSAEWCGQCKMSELILDKVQASYPNIQFIELDVDDNGLWNNDSLDISEVPTYVGFNNRQTIFNHKGYKNEKEIIALLNELN